jgi:hypothetical protein
MAWVWTDDEPKEIQDDEREKFKQINQEIADKIQQAYVLMKEAQQLALDNGMEYEFDINATNRLLNKWNNSYCTDDSLVASWNCTQYEDWNSSSC